MTMNSEDQIAELIRRDKEKGVDWEGIGVIDTRPENPAWLRSYTLFLRELPFWPIVIGLALLMLFIREIERL